MDERASHVLRETFGNDVIALALEHPSFFHLDAALFPIHDDLIAYYPGAFAPAARATLDALDCDRIVLDDAEARRWACNGVVLGDVVFVTKGASGIVRELERRKLAVAEVDVSEFMKFGGGIKCLTLQHEL